MTKRWDEIDRYVVISSDAHAGADLWDYKPYLDKKWQDDFDAWANSYVSPYDDLIHATANRNWDDSLRIPEMDADGVCGEVLIPNTIPPFFPNTSLLVFLPKTREDFEYRWAGIQAHNRWIVDFVAQQPLRRKGTLQIYPHDVDLALEEIRWAKETGAFCGVLLCQVPPGHVVEPLFHTRYEPMWALCEELDMPILFHNSVPADMPMDQPASNALTVLKGGIWNQSSLIDILIAGVFERYPNLKLIPTESGLDWPMQTALKLDPRVRAMQPQSGNRSFEMFGGGSVNDLSLLPSEYVRRNVYYGLSAQGASPTSMAMRYDVGVDHIMWGSDYPHEEGTTPQTTLSLRWMFQDIPEQEIRMMLAGNAGNIYGFDLDALIPLAEKIGPKVSEVATPVTADDFKEPVNQFVQRPFPGGSLLTRIREADSGFAG
jgi:predicted TIM-barrel fold metal-dependent hydrolase